MSKGGQQQSKTLADPRTQMYIERLRQEGANQGIGATRGAAAGFHGAIDAGNLGFGALTGGENPFLNTYMDALNPVFDDIRARSLASVGDQATRAGAYGGSRHGVAEGVALGEVGKAQGLANIDAFNQAQQRALQVANLGFGGAQGLSNLGQGLMSIPTSPLGMQSWGPKPQNDWLSQLMGLGMTAASFA